MPTPSMQGSRLPRMFPTRDWGYHINASDRKSRGSLAGGAASSASSGTGFGGGGANHSATNLSDTVSALLFGGSHAGGASTVHGGGRGGRHGHHPSHLPQEPSKLHIFETYVQRFPLDSPTTASPIINIMEGGAESAVVNRKHLQQQHVRFAVDEMAGGGGGGGSGGDDNNNLDETGRSGGGGGGGGDDDNNDEGGGGGYDDPSRAGGGAAATGVSSMKRRAEEAARESFELLRKQKVDSWLQMAERNLRKVRRENETLSAIAHLTQSNALINDERYERALESLRAEAELADELRQAGHGPMMQEFSERIDCIQRDMTRIVVETNKRTIEELTELRENFEKELEKYQKELDDERNSGLSTKLDWIQKNRDLHRAVTEEMMSSDVLARDHLDLEVVHRRRRLDASLTIDEVHLLEETVDAARRRNAQLKDRLGTLECELSLAQARESRARAERAGIPGGEFSAGAGGGGVSAASSSSRQHQLYSSNLPPAVRSVTPNAGVGAGARPSSAASSHAGGGHHHHGAAGGEPQPQRPPTAQSTASAATTATTTLSSTSTDEAMAAEAQTLFDRISRTIAIEGRNLQTARHAHTEALKQRTELEVYLKHAIIEYQSQLENLHYSVRHGIKADSGGTGVAAISSHHNSRRATATASSTPANHHHYASSSTRTPLQDRANSDGTQKLKKVEPTVFTVEDRQAVVDSLLSLPRVLALMFDPVSAATALRRKNQQKRRLRSADRRRRASTTNSDGGQVGEEDEQHSDEYDSDSSSVSSSLLPGGGGGGGQHDQQQQQHAATRMSAADARLYDDLAKLGVDVVGSRSGFVFHPASPTDDRAAGEGGGASGAADAGGGVADPMVVMTGAPPPLGEDELWERWNRWSKTAEKNVAAHARSTTRGKK